MSLYIKNYNVGKKLERELLEYLNTTQPFKFFDIQTQTYLPICPYYQSFYRYSSFDIYNNYLTIELKSRSNNYSILNTNILDTNKIINNHSIFCFTYNNQSEILTDLHFINYENEVFDDFYIQICRNGDRVFVIPTPSLTKLDTKQTHTHQININYTEDYKERLMDIISRDKTNYISTFGLYSILND